MISESAINAAYNRAQAGDAAEACNMLLEAGQRGDSAALLELAIWHLRTDIMPRNVALARTYLRKAVEIGHPDAALLEVALTANGSGASSDWPGALRLLGQAAKSNPTAQAHINLLRAMDLSEQGYPTAPLETEALSADPVILRCPGFLSSAECEHIAQATVNLLAPSVVVDPASGRQIQNPIRTSFGALIGPTREDLVIRAINNRIARLSGTRVEQGESLTILRYGVGQQYRLHLDAIGDAANQRILTVLLYLNQGFAGGETVFPALSVSITPKAGDAILFANVDVDQMPDQRTCHAGLPIRSGVKWLATRWIRALPLDPWNWAAA